LRTLPILATILPVILSFPCKETARIHRGEESRKFPRPIQSRAKLLLARIDQAASINDLSVPPGNRLHLLKGNLSGFWSVSINDPWLISFRWSGTDATDVRITDYH
jgi:proteic killer suppression protein